MTAVEGERPLVYVAEEVLAMSRFSKSMLYRHAAEGSLPFPALRVGRSWRFPAAPFDRWLAGESEAVAS